MGPVEWKPSRFEPNRDVPGLLWWRPGSVEARAGVEVQVALLAAAKGLLASVGARN